MRRMNAKRKMTGLAVVVLSIGILRGAAAMAGATTDFTAAAGGAMLESRSYDGPAPALNEALRGEIMPPSSVLIGEVCGTPTNEELDLLERHELLMAELEHIARIAAESSAAILQEARTSTPANGQMAGDPAAVIALALGW